MFSLSGLLTRTQPSCREQALDALHKHCFSMGEVLDDVTEAVNNKIPAVRTETLLWFGRCIELSVTQKPRNRIAVNKTNLKSFMTIIMLVRMTRINGWFASNQSTNQPINQSMMNE